MPDAVVMTPQGLAALREELERLENVERPQIIERIKTAREWGDLKENAEYHDAKNAQALLERKITLLRAKLDDAVAVEVDANSDRAMVGSTVTVTNESNGKEVTYTLVGSAEADAAIGLLSVESPVGEALVGSKVGEIAVVETPRGEQRLKVTAVGI